MKNNKRLTTLDIEIALANYFDYRRNLIIPNVYWGFGLQYEADMLVISQSNYVHEVEIKISVADFKAEKKKKYFAHYNSKIKKFSYAVPDYLKNKIIELIDDNSGLFCIGSGGYVSTIKAPKIIKNARSITFEERLKLAELGSMRIWSLKNILNRKIIKRR